jgi:23S rRNA (adenine2503-C2)-methyltransferase
MGIESHASTFVPPPRPDGKVNLVGLSREDLAAAFAELEEPAFRARQLWGWIYKRGETDFARMSNLARTLRTKLADHFVVDRPSVVRQQVSMDGTRKWLARMTDGQEIESVHIPEEDRGTLCVSSQVGCTLNCRFCHTGTQRLVRNLESSEIVGQVLLARDVLMDWGREGDDRQLTNIVMMGMGEPLYNFDNVKRALAIVTDAEGIALSRRRITLSTAGVVPLIERCGAEIGVNLAISLHAVTDELRDEIVPINRKYPIATLLDACRAYPGLSNARRITFEYVMLKDVNDSPADARALVRLLRGIPAKINLIPFNSWPGAPFECAAAGAIERFAAILMDSGFASPIRAPRGRDILAACGQLKSDSVRLRAAERLAAAAA